MSTTGASAASGSARRRRPSDPGPRRPAPPGPARGARGGPTLAQLYCLLGGLSLLLAGIFGFLADGSFDVGDSLSRDSFLGFDVNGWHNVVHLASGLLLLAVSRSRRAGKSTALGFGLVYGAVAVIG